jgi:hypothetical protein
MRFVLTIVVSSCTYMSDGSGQPSRIGATPQSCTESFAAIRRPSRGGGETRCVLLYFRSASLPLSRPSAPTQSAASCGESKDLVYGQASGEGRTASPQARIGHALYLERGSVPGFDRMVGSRARAWLKGVDAGDMQSPWNIVLIVGWWISWPKLTIFSCQTNTGRLESQKNGGNF